MSKEPIVEEGSPVIVRDLRAEKRAAKEQQQAEETARDPQPTAVVNEDVESLQSLMTDDVDAVLDGQGNVLLCRFCAPEGGKHSLLPENEHPALREVAYSTEEETHLVMNRLERIHELQEKGHTTVGLTDEEKSELLRLHAEEEAAREEEQAARANVRTAHTAFMVVIDHMGMVTASPDCNLDLEIDREATLDDMYTGAAVLMRDIQASINARHVVGHLQASARHAAETQAAAQMAQGLDIPGRRGRRGR